MVSRFRQKESSFYLDCMRSVWMRNEIMKNIEKHTITENRKKIISEIKFDTFIMSNSYSLEINNENVSEQLKNPNTICIVFKNCEITELRINNVYRGNIIFENCEIDKIVIENNMMDTSNDSIIINGGSIKEFIINNAEIRNHLHINHNSGVKLKIQKFNRERK